jgi:putative aldouronate transport system permease protein
VKKSKKKIEGFDIFLVVFLGLICIIMLYPFWYTFIGSIIPYSEYLSKTFLLFPNKIDLSAYRQIFESGDILRPLFVTAFVTIVGTFLCTFFTATAAYALSKKFPGSALIVNLIILTMVLRPGLIPQYINLKRLGLINSIWVYILPTLIIVYNFVIMRTSFAAFPKDIEESARIDGCSEYGIFFKFVIPLSKAILATVALFYAVQLWNTYSASVFYVTDNKLKTIQEYLSRIIMEDPEANTEEVKIFSETVKLANVIVSVTPILIVYPFLQKYFVKGVMIGSVKG